MYYQNGADKAVMQLQECSNRQATKAIEEAIAGANGADVIWPTVILDANRILGR